MDAIWIPECQSQPSAGARVYYPRKHVVHRLERPGELPAVARETEPNIPFAIETEVDAGYAANPAAPDQELGHRP